MTSGLISGITAGYDFQTLLDTDLECSFCIQMSYKIGILCETQLSAEDRSFLAEVPNVGLPLVGKLINGAIGLGIRQQC